MAALYPQGAFEPPSAAGSRCPSCDARVELGTAVCRHCGFDLHSHGPKAADGDLDGDIPRETHPPSPRPAESTPLAPDAPAPPDVYSLQPQWTRAAKFAAATLCPRCDTTLSPQAVVCVACGFDLRTGEARATVRGPVFFPAHVDFPNPKGAFFLVWACVTLLAPVVAVLTGVATHSAAAALGALLGVFVTALPLYRFVAKRSYIRYEIRPAEGRRPPIFAGRSRAAFITTNLFRPIDLGKYSEVFADEEQINPGAGSRNFLTFLAIWGWLDLSAAILWTRSVPMEPRGTPARLNFTNPENGRVKDVPFPDDRTLRKVAALFKQATELDIEWLCKRIGSWQDV